MRDMSTLPLVCGFFKGIKPEEVNGLLACLGARILTRRKGETLFRAGVLDSRKRHFILLDSRQV